MTHSAHDISDHRQENFCIFTVACRQCVITQKCIRSETINERLHISAPEEFDL